MPVIKRLICLLFFCFSPICANKGSGEYTYYPDYNIVRSTQGSFFNLTYPVTKVEPDKAQGHILGYVSYKNNNEPIKQQYALVLNSAQSDRIGVDITHHGSGLLLGPGIPVLETLEE